MFEYRCGLWSENQIFSYRFVNLVVEIVKLYEKGNNTDPELKN